jgi:hypothetical protein
LRTGCVQFLGIGFPLLDTAHSLKVSQIGDFPRIKADLITIRTLGTGNALESFT